MSVFKKSDFLVRVRKRRAHDCKDAGDRATQEAKAENPSVYIIHDGLSTRLTPLTMNDLVKDGILIAQKCIF